MKLLLIGTLSLLSLNALAAKFECPKPEAPTAHQWVKNIYEVTFSTECAVTEVTQGNLKNLIAYFLGRAVKNVKVNQGPTSEKFEDLSSIVFDVTESTVNPHGDRQTTQSLVHVASDNATRALYFSESILMTGTGDSKYQKKSDVRMELKKTSASTASVIYSYTAHVSKAPIITQNYMKKRVDESVREDFVKNEARDLEEIVQHF